MNGREISPAKQIKWEQMKQMLNHFHMETASSWYDRGTLFTGTRYREKNGLHPCHLITADDWKRWEWGTGKTTGDSGTHFLSARFNWTRRTELETHTMVEATPRYPPPGDMEIHLAMAQLSSSHLDRSKTYIFVVVYWTFSGLTEMLKTTTKICVLDLLELSSAEKVRNTHICCRFLSRWTAPKTIQKTTTKYVFLCFPSWVGLNWAGLSRVDLSWGDRKVQNTHICCRLLNILRGRVTGRFIESTRYPPLRNVQKTTTKICVLDFPQAELSSAQFCSTQLGSNHSRKHQNTHICCRLFNLFYGWCSHLKNINKMYVFDSEFRYSVIAHSEFRYLAKNR